MAERMNLLGGKVDTSERWDNRGFLVECYNEYVRMCQLMQRSAITKRYISSMNFGEYLQESKKNLEFHRQQMARELLSMKINKREHDFAYQIARKSEEAIDWYFTLDEKKQNQVVYPEFAPDEKSMKQLVEKQVEEDTIANMPVAGTKGPHGGASLELKNVTKEEARKEGGSTVKVDESIKKLIKEK